jgi:magnesium transporter
MIIYRFRSRASEALQVLEEPRPGVWIDVEEIGDQDAERLIKTHGLDAGMLADARDFFETPRLDHEEGVSYFFTRYPTSLEASGSSTAPILIAIGADFLLTSVSKRPPFLEKLKGSTDVYTTQKTKFFLQIIAAVTQEYTRVFNSVRKEVSRTRMNVRDVSERSIEQLVHLEYTLNEFVTALVPTNEALQRLLAGSYVQLYEADVDLVEDVQLANAQLIEGAKSSLKTIQNIRSAHAALVSNRLNKVVRTLTALTMLFMIPTTVGALYGMNVALPFDSHVNAFWILVVFTSGLTVAAAYVFRQNEWL